MGPKVSLIFAVEIVAADFNNLQKEMLKKNE